MNNSTQNADFNNLLNLCMQQHKIKGVIQKSILDIISDSDKQDSFLTFANSQIRDKVFTDKIAKFQNNLNQKTTQEIHFQIGEEDRLTEVIALVRDPKSTLKQAERPFIFLIKEAKKPKIKTLQEEIDAFKKKMAKEFDADLAIVIHS